MSDTFAFVLIALSGFGLMFWGLKALWTKEFHGRYRFTSKEYTYRRSDEPWRYWAETLTVLIGGLWMFYIDFVYIFPEVQAVW